MGDRVLAGVALVPADDGRDGGTTIASVGLAAGAGASAVAGA